MKRLCVLAALPSGGWGGTEANLVRYIRHLRDRVRFRLAVWERGSGRLLAEAARHGVECRVVGAPPRAWLRLSDWARDADLVHSFLLRGHLLAAPVAAVSGRPWLAAERGIEDFRGRAGRALRARLLRRARFVLPVTESVAARVRSVDGVADDRIRVVPGGVEVPADANAPPRNTPPRIACVAHLRPEKGHGRLLRAFARFLREGGEAQLDLIGDGSLRRSLAAEATRLGIADRVRFLGEVPGAAARMREYDLVVLASDEEGHPNVVLEAQAQGVPVLAPDLPAVREFVEDGRTGFLFRARDEEDLARRLREVLAFVGEDAGRLRSLLAAGREAASRRTPALAAERLWEVYREAMGEGLGKTPGLD